MKKFYICFLACLTLNIPSVFAQTICTMGDWGTNSIHQQKVANVMTTHGCTDIFLLGDNFYSRGVQSSTDPKWFTHFENIYQNLLARGAHFFAALGNHDYLGNAYAQIEYGQTHPQWILPHHYYYTMIHNDCFFIIDSNTSFQEQANWLATTLAQAQCRFKTLIDHHPFRSSGAHGDTGGDLERTFGPLLGYFDLVLSGHDHQFSDEGNIYSGSRFGLSRPAGPRQQVVGTGGADPRAGSCRRGSDCRFFTAENGFLKLIPQNDRLEFHFFTEDNEERYFSYIERSTL